MRAYSAGAMTLDLPTTLALLALGLVAGGLGALLGLGGGVLVVPTLVLGFGVDIRVAVATSLVAVVATSTAAGSVATGRGLANFRLGMTLEVFTTLGGIAGSLASLAVPQAVLSAVLAVLLLVTATLMLRGREAAAKSGAATPRGAAEPPGVEAHGQLAGEYYDAHLGALVPYRVERMALGAGVSFVAGVLSGLLGIGGGFLKMPAMTLGMKVPFKVAAATSNFMIGVTAATSLFIYFSGGLLQPALASPVTLGVVGGALAGAAMSRRVSATLLRRALAAVLLLVAGQLLWRALGGRHGA